MQLGPWKITPTPYHHTTPRHPNSHSRTAPQHNASHPHQSPQAARHHTLSLPLSLPLSLTLALSLLGFLACVHSLTIRSLTQRPRPFSTCRGRRCRALCCRDGLAARSARPTRTPARPRSSATSPGPTPPTVAARSPPFRSTAQVQQQKNKDKNKKKANVCYYLLLLLS